jgi:hypothetical protein
LWVLREREFQCGSRSEALIKETHGKLGPGGTTMSLSPAQVAHQQKIQSAKRELEFDNGGRIKMDKIQDWALLDICEMLQSIHFALAQANMPKIGMQK